MLCPYCSHELGYHDWFGTNMGRNPHKTGDIYICQNEDCEAYEQHFYTRINDNELYEGFPC